MLLFFQDSKIPSETNDVMANKFTSNKVVIEAF